MLYQLKRAGIGQHDLVTIYVSVIRPVLEYACPVWHTNLNNHLKLRALKQCRKGRSNVFILAMNMLIFCV